MPVHDNWTRRPAGLSNRTIYLTDNAYLLHRPNRYAAMTVEGAMAVIGLHQRLRGHVVLGGGLGGLVGTWQWQMIQARALLPASPRASSEAGSGLPDRATRLIGAAHQRLEKVLAARDQLLLSSMQRKRLRGADEPADSVERVAIALQGMFDTLARALNACLPAPLEEHRVTWQQKHFLKPLSVELRRAATDPKFAVLRSVIGELRNTVHHEPVGRGACEANGLVEKLVALPSSSTERFRENADRLGRRERWVAFDDGIHGLMLHPIVLCDDVILHAVAAADRLLASFPWGERDESPETLVDSHDWIAYPPYSAMNRLLYGL